MTYTEYDVYPAWSSKERPMKVWATSKTAYKRYIDDTRYRYHLLFAYDLVSVNIPEIDHVQIVRDEARFYFKSKVGKTAHAGQFTLEKNLIYAWHGKVICALYLQREE